MLESCDIHPGLGCPLVTQIIEIPRQMGHLTQLYESSDVPHESMNLPTVNTRRLL